MSTSGSPYSTIGGSPLLVSENLETLWQPILQLGEHHTSLDLPRSSCGTELSQSQKALAKQVGADKVEVAQNLAQVVQVADLIITNLANDTVVETVYDEFDKALAATPAIKPKVFVETSTVIDPQTNIYLYSSPTCKIYPVLAGHLDKIISKHAHAHMITAPVFGTPKAAAARELLIVMSGDYYLGKKQASYILVPAVGRKVLDLGANLEKAPTFKLIGNSMILGILEVLSESFTLGDKVGIDADMILNFVKEIIPAPNTISYAERMANNRFEASQGFEINGGIKDAHLIRKLTNEYNSPMPTIDIAHQHLLTARAINETRLKTGADNAIPNLDWSGLIAGSRTAAALEPFTSTKHANQVVEEDS
ncbi:NAD(P)-binding protein [Flagelloscypha sp. PMI_526]|nr:NAD(P)-binding protein [Flagelloscypha sp. PMI_526]